MKRRHSLLEAPGAANFVTTTVVNFIPIFTKMPLAEIVLKNIKFYSQKYQIQIHGFVIMPNHVHLLASNEANTSISKFIGPMKEYSAKQIIHWCRENKEMRYLKSFSISATESKQGHRYQVWQQRYDNVVITRYEDMMIKLNYIHNNPMQERWNLCGRPEEYTYSSAPFYYEDKEVSIPICRIT